MILREVNGELGVVLWKSLRSVLLWAETEASSRLKLFDADAAARRHVEILAAVPPEDVSLREALEDLLPVMDRADSVEPEFVGGACGRIAGWAEAQQAPRTQLEFLQAAAACRPEDVGFALAIGGVARDLAHYARAEAWLYRAVGLARASGQWQAYITAYLRHGVMMYRRGALPAARRSLLKALRRSRRQGIRDSEGRSLHDLANLEYRAGDLAATIKYAAQAVEAYGPQHEVLPRLAHDVAYYWLEEGYFKQSLLVFNETLSRVGEADRPTVLGSVARAAAGVNDLATYRRVSSELRACSSGPGLAEAWMDVAHAALMLNRHEEAEAAASLAESVARALQASAPQGEALQSAPPVYA